MNVDFKLRSSSYVRFSDDGSHVVSLGSRITLWSVSKGRRVASGPWFPDPSSADFSPDGALLAVKNTSGDVLVLSVPDLEVVSRLSAGLGEGTAVRFAENGRHVVDGSWGGVLMVRDAIDGSTVWAERDASVFRLTCTRDRSTWAYDRVRGRGQTLSRRWPFDTHDPEPVAFYGGPLAVAISDDGSRIAALSAGLELAERDPRDGGWGQPRQIYPAPFGPDQSLCWGPNGELVYTHRTIARVFDDSRAEPRGLRLPFQVFDVAVSPQAMVIAFGGHDQGLVIDWPLQLTDAIEEEPSQDLSQLMAKVFGTPGPTPGSRSSEPPT